MATLDELYETGQSAWLDSITREWLDDGTLGAWITERGIRGVTSNPSIFAAALKSSTYDSEIHELAEQGLDDREIFSRIATSDIARACDLLLPLYEASGHDDGFVSIEIEPDLANDGAQSIVRGIELWREVDQPNLMIKVPATNEGLKVFEELVFDGINVNVTLLFAVEMYERVLHHWMNALERRVDAGRNLDVSSVASFFVSRVDTKVDALLAEDSPLRGKVAVANAQAAWLAFRRNEGSDRWKALKENGARAQRPLWASTGTKNASYSDVLYVQPLIAPGTVNTLPLATIEAFEDHGIARIGLTDEVAKTGALLLDTLAESGISLSDVTDELLTEGVQAFVDAFDALIASIAARRTAAIS